ncbi:MAG TPA: NAD-dependent epimerase/dehydratase family protein [Anaerolineae bacterium]|jgi:dihydroflavonol-4-reductase
MKVLITGATGFIGANLVEAVTQRGWQAVALRRKTSSLRAMEGLTYESTFGDVTDFEALVTAMRGVDIVFHAAAVADYWRTGIKRLYEVNVDGTRNVMKAAKSVGVRRVVFTSSVAALGLPAFGQMLDELAAFNQPPEQFHYGYSKVLAERVVQEYVADGLDAVIVNPAVVIGPRDVNFISGSIIIEEARHAIPVYPPGGVCVIDVADVCAGEIGAAERGRTGERYILGGDNLWYRDLVAITAQVVGRRPARIRLSRPVIKLAALVVEILRKLQLQLPIDGDQMRMSAETMWFDSTKARREFGLRPRPYREAAQRAYDWYKSAGLL